MKTRLQRRARTLGTAPACESGFGALESIIALTLFLIVSVSIGTLMASGVAAQRLTRQKTAAEQLAAGQVASVRNLSYSDVGVPGGNPAGLLTATQHVTQSGLKATITTAVAYASDGQVTDANAPKPKVVTVTVTRDSDSKVLSTQSTTVSSFTQSPVSNKATVKVKLVDFINSLPATGVTVTLNGHTFGTQTQVTDASGYATFSNLQPNDPNVVNQDYYDITTAYPIYATHPSDVPNAVVAHVQLAPAQLLSTTIRVWQPPTVNVSLVDVGNNPFLTSTKVHMPSGWTNIAWYTVTTGSKSMVPPAVNIYPQTYGIFAWAADTATTRYFSNYATTVVPPVYPSSLTNNVKLTMTKYNICTLTVYVQDNSSVPQTGATVTLTNGSVKVFLDGFTTAGAQGSVAVVLPQATAFTVSVSKSGLNASAVKDCSGATDSVTIKLPAAGSGGSGNPPPAM